MRPPLVLLITPGYPLQGTFKRHPLMGKNASLAYRDRSGTSCFCLGGLNDGIDTR